MDILKLVPAKTADGLEFLDFEISGESFYSLSGKTGLTCLGHSLDEYENKQRDILSLIAPADLPKNRRAIIVCEQCGDRLCGGKSIVISDSNNIITWEKFEFFEFNYEDNDFEFYPSSNLRTFRFQKNQYLEALKYEKHIDRSKNKPNRSIWQYLRQLVSQNRR